MTDAAPSQAELEPVLARALSPSPTDTEPIPVSDPEAAVHRSWSIRAVTDANRGRGVFSRVYRVDLDWAEHPPSADHPPSVVIKLPTRGANDAAALASGAYEREALAYRRLLPRSPVRHPRVHLVEQDPAGRTTLVLEDLATARMVDQLDGLDLDDAASTMAELARFHRAWRRPDLLTDLPVRRATPSALDPGALARGLDHLDDRWGDVLEPAPRRAFDLLLARRHELVTAFAAAADPTLCHGDPRADNLAFEPGGRAILFDWQQTAIQAGEADLAWLAATSLRIEDRRRVERSLVEEYGSTLDRYRLGLVLPGLAVLLLAQRHVDDDRSARFVATSIARIGAALDDLDVARADGG